MLAGGCRSARVAGVRLVGRCATPLGFRSAPSRSGPSQGRLSCDCAPDGTYHRVRLSFGDVTLRHHLAVVSLAQQGHPCSTARAFTHGTPEGQTNHAFASGVNTASHGRCACPGDVAARLGIVFGRRGRIRTSGVLGTPDLQSGAIGRYATRRLSGAASGVLWAWHLCFAGAERFELPTSGFGDRRSDLAELHPFAVLPLGRTRALVGRGCSPGSGGLELRLIRPAMISLGIRPQGARACELGRETRIARAEQVDAEQTGPQRIVFA